jgi:N4-gp56 family major capsid protein
MATTPTYPDELIPLMEQRLHMEPVPKYIFHQFVMEQFDFTAQPGDTIRVEGPVFADPVSDPTTDRKLATLASKVSDNAVQNFSMNKQEITLEEYLLKNAYQLKEYDVKHSIHDIAEINGSVLAEDYHNWRDSLARYRFEQNTYRNYVGGTSLATLAGTDYYTTDFFLKVAGSMSDAHIPQFPDGNFIAIIDPLIKSTLLQEQKFLDATTRGIASSAPIFTGELGVYGGVRFIESNNIPKKTGGTSPTFNASQAFMFGTSLFGLFPLGSAEGLINREREDFLRGQGAGPLVQLIGMPVEVRPWEITDYGRFSSVIWIEHSFISPLDPNPGDGKTKGVDTRFSRTLYGATKSL